MQTVQSISKEQEIEATTFEIATAAAFHLINEARVDVMVIECGMGGETDATNVIPPQLVLASGLTCVGLDHTSFLGDTVEAITQVKAGICVRDGLLVVGPQVYPSVHSVASQVAQQRGARLVTCHPAQSDLSDGRVEVNLGDFQKPPPTRFSLDTASGTRIDGTLSLVGDHQLDNVSTAINILTEIARDRRALSIQPKLAQVVQDAITRGVSLAEWPGRCSFVYYKPHGRTGRGFPVLVDGAHNADSATRLRAYIDTLEITSDAGPIGNVTWIIGLSDSTKSGKSIESVLDPLLRSGDRVYPTMFSPVESMPWVQPVPTDGETGLGMAAGKIVGRDQVVMVPTKTSGTESLEEILERISDKSSEDRGLIVLAGSLYLVADLYRLLGSR
jgi:folylpolyglutamate synthase